MDKNFRRPVAICLVVNEIQQAQGANMPRNLIQDLNYTLLGRQEVASIESCLHRLKLVFDLFCLLWFGQHEHSEAAAVFVFKSTRTRAGVIACQRRRIQGERLIVPGLSGFTGHFRDPNGVSPNPPLHVPCSVVPRGVVN